MASLGICGIVELFRPRGAKRYTLRHSTKVAFMFYDDWKFRRDRRDNLDPERNNFQKYPNQIDHISNSLYLILGVILFVAFLAAIFQAELIASVFDYPIIWGLLLLIMSIFAVNLVYKSIKTGETTFKSKVLTGNKEVTFTKSRNPIKFWMVVLFEIYMVLFFIFGSLFILSSW